MGRVRRGDRSAPYPAAPGDAAAAVVAVRRPGAASATGRDRDALARMFCLRRAVHMRHPERLAHTHGDFFPSGTPIEAASRPLDVIWTAWRGSSRFSVAARRATQ